MSRSLWAVMAVLMLSSCFGTYGVYSEYDDGYPPDTYIATATPVYYEGYPSYYYGGRWYRREGVRWHAYRDEPVYLRDYRTRSAPVYRQSYGRGRYYGSSNVHGAAPVRGAGGRRR